MKKYVLKNWVQYLILFILAVLFILFFTVTSYNMIELIIHKIIIASLFIIIGDFLVKHSDLED